VVHLLAFDIGNTRTKLGLFGPGGLERVLQFEAADLRSVASCRRALGSLPGRFRSADAAVVGSVVPARSDMLASAVEQALKVRPLVVSHTSKLPIRNRYAVASQVGVDRLAGACGGAALYGVPLIVVDAGTAITIDVVSRRREFLGGAILPGISLGAAALAHATAKLPHVALNPPRRAIGRTTDENIRVGLFLGASGAVDGIIRRCWKELGYRTPAVVTGGAGEAIAAGSVIVRRVEPDLTLLGLRSIYELNA
jgi:type III pantothenate kinase